MSLSRIKWSMLVALSWKGASLWPRPTQLACPSTVPSCMSANHGAIVRGILGVHSRGAERVRDTDNLLMFERGQWRERDRYE